jgi:hypothetical protein
MKYLVTGMVEFYQFVEVDSEEKVRSHINMNSWRQTQYSTMEETVKDIRIKQAEVETTGEEVK